jgi:hypothetical protein
VRLYLVVSLLFFAAAAAEGGGNPPALVVTLPAGGRPSVTTAPLAGEAGSLISAKPGETPDETVARICDGMQYDGPWKARLAPVLRANCARVVRDNGRPLAQALTHNLPRAMFIFLPVFALLMKLMYWRPPRYFVEHLLLLVHDQAFVFMVVMLYWLAAALLRSGLPRRLVLGAICLWVPYYLYRSFRRVYAQDRWLTLTKVTVLSGAYLALAVMTLAMTFLYSAATL